VSNKVVCLHGFGSSRGNDGDDVVREINLGLEAIRSGNRLEGSRSDLRDVSPESLVRIGGIEIGFLDQVLLHLNKLAFEASRHHVFVCAVGNLRHVGNIA